MKIGSLCTGYGGLELALTLAGIDHKLVFVADPDSGASAVLAARFAGVPNLGDISLVDWRDVGPVDLLTAGFPCTDVSVAGAGAGIVPERWIVPDSEPDMRCGCVPGNHKTWCPDVSLGAAPADAFDTVAAVAAAEALNRRDRDDHPEWMVAATRSGVWTQVARAVAELRPSLVLIENVRGLLSARAHSDVEPCPWCLGDRGGDDQEPVLRALGAVLGNLSDLGYDAEWVTVAASDVGCAHRRERVFIVAWPADTEGDPRRFLHGDLPPVAAAFSEPGVLLPTPRTSDANGSGSHGDGGIDLRTAVSLLPTPKVSDAHHTATATSYGTNQSPSAGAAVRPSLDGLMRLLPTPMAADAGTLRGSSAGNGLRNTSREISMDWGPYAAAIARWEANGGRRAPAPTEPGHAGKPRLSPRFVEWMMGLPAGWVCDVPGLSRNDMLRLLGNGVVPQQGAAALRQLANIAQEVAA